MTKKILMLLLSLALVFALLFSITSCRFDKNKDDDEDDDDYYGDYDEDDEDDEDDETTSHTHEYGEWVTITDPTCVDSGVKRKTCYYCDDYKERTVPANGVHDYYNGYCDVCGLEDPDYFNSTANFTFSDNGNGTYSVSGVTGFSGGFLDIPSYYNGYPVTAITSSAFSYNDDIVDVSIPDTITTIYDSAFYSCASLEYIYIPSSVKSIENYVFYDCNSLMRVDMTDGLLSIGESAFAYCDNLSTISIPDTIEFVGANAFECCYNLTYNYYDNFQYLGNDYNPYVVLTGITDQSQNFYNMYWTTKVIMPYAFTNCDYVKSITVPGSVTYIGSYAFYDCDRLQTISIGYATNYIGSNAFYGSYNLTNVYFSDASGWASYESNYYNYGNPIDFYTINDSASMAEMLKYGNYSILRKNYN